MNEWNLAWVLRWMCLRPSRPRVLLCHLSKMVTMLDLSRLIAEFEGQNLCSNFRNAVTESTEV